MAEPDLDGGPPAGLRFTVLGPVGVFMDGEPVAIGSPGARALLLLLLVHANQVVSAVPAARTWLTRSYGSRSEDPQPGDDVYDVSSMSSRIGLDGIPYNAW